MSYSNQAPSGRDPYQSFDAPAPPPVSIDTYALPKSRAPLWIGMGAIIAIAAIILVALNLPSAPPAQTSSPTPSPVATRTAPVSPSPVGSQPPSVGFEDRAVGWWRIDSQQWTSRGLELTVTLAVADGEQDFSFFCFDSNRNVVESNNSFDADAFPTRIIGAGEEVTGIVIFGVDPGDTTVVLANGHGTQISALMVKGP